MSSLLSITDLSLQIDNKTILQPLTLKVQRGEILGLAGESGSGKSSLANCIAGLLPYSGGKIELAGLPLKSQRSAKDFAAQAGLLQMVFQDPYTAVNPRWRVADILTEPLLHLPQAQKDHLVEQWLARVALPQELRTAYPAMLSGGQLQRLNIARALINEPALLICDEALAALDVSTQAQVANLLKDLRDQLGTSLLFIGHDLGMMNFLCDRIAVMHQGCLVEVGDTAQIINQPRQLYTQTLVNNAKATH